MLSLGRRLPGVWRGSFIVLITFALNAAFSTTARAQNPFDIDGTITDADNSGVAGATKATDPNGNAKELGPKNGSPTKVGVIHSAPLPMLEVTNPNGQVDLNTVWIQDAQSADLHTWLYFAWARDSETGSGFLSIEIQHSAVDPACDYSKNNAQLIATCNPWKNRQEGDFILLWDQQGSSTTIYLRTFDLVGGNLVLGPAVPLDGAVSAAMFSADGFRGEAAVDLTGIGVFPLGQCVNLANIIPNTVTGNSDSADYKDTVLRPFPPIQNCGTVTVKKLLVAPPDLQATTGSFNYQLTAGGAIIKSPNVTQHTGSDADAPNNGPLTQHNDLNTHSSILPGTAYTLDENAISPDLWVKKKISCTVGGQTYVLFTDDGGLTVAAFPVVAGETTACTIENKVVGSPDAATVQGALLFDTLNLTDVVDNAGKNVNVTFSLWKNSTCAGANQQVGSNVTVSIVFGTADGGYVSGQATSSGTPITIGSNDGTYWWKVVYPGDGVNQGFTDCHENTVIVFNN